MSVPRMQGFWEKYYPKRRRGDFCQKSTIQNSRGNIRKN